TCATPSDAPDALSHRRAVGGLQHRRRGAAPGRRERLPAQPGLLRRADLAQLPGQGVRRRQEVLGSQLPRRRLGPPAGADAAAVGGHGAASGRLGPHLPLHHRAAPVHQHRLEPSAHPPRRAPDPRRPEADRAQRPRGHPGQDVGERAMIRRTAVNQGLRRESLEIVCPLRSAERERVRPYSSPDGSTEIEQDQPPHPVPLRKRRGQTMKRFRGVTRVAAAVLVLAASGVRVAHAEEEGAVVRVIAEEAEVRTGPGFAYRTVYVATRGETLKADARASRDYWFHVVLPDGTYGWIIGDQVLPLDVDPTAPQPPTWGERFVSAVFSPAPLQASDV